jgi:hypothetical protein
MHETRLIYRRQQCLVCSKQLLFRYCHAFETSIGMRKEDFFIKISDDDVLL